MWMVARDSFERLVQRDQPLLAAEDGRLGAVGEVQFGVPARRHLPTVAIRDAPVDLDPGTT